MKKKIINIIVKRNKLTKHLILWITFFLASTGLMAQDFMMQGWYWNYPKPDCDGYEGPSLAEIMAARAEAQAEAGFTMMWMPPLTNASFGECSNGYDPRDLYDYGQVSGRTGLGTGNEVEDWIAAMAANGIYPIADVVYNHRDGGEWEDNPAVRDYIMNYPNGGGCSGFPATPYPVNGKMRYRLPLGGSSGNGAGDYYFKFSSASGDAGFHGGEYKLYFRTQNTDFVDDPIHETENNGGGDCNQGNDQIWLGRDIFAAQETTTGCNTDEFYLQLEVGDFIEEGDFLEIYIEEIGGGGTGIDQRIYGIWSGPRGEDIIDELKVQTSTDFTDMPSGQGAMHWRHFKPNGITHTCLTGDLDFPFFFFDVEQEYDGTQGGESTRQVYDDWNKWLWNTVGIRGFRMDAVKHFPASFVGELLNDLHAAGIHPPMVVGEWFGTDTGELSGWVNEVYDNMNEPAKEDIVPRIFDFSLREALRQACDQYGYDVRQVYNASIVDQGLLNGINVVTFVNNHDFRGDEGFNSLIQNTPILAYAYILTNNQLGLPTVFYPDYYGYPAPGEPGYKSYHPSDKDPLRDEIDQLMHIHREYIFGASSRTYLNADGSGFSNSADGDNSYIMTYQLKDGPAGFEDIVVAINFGGDAVGFSQQLDNIPFGTQLKDLTGNAIFATPTVENANNVDNSIWISLPPRSYAIYRAGAWGLFEADRSWIGFDKNSSSEWFSVWDNGPGDIQNHDFGVFDSNGELVLNAYDIKTWKQSGGDVTDGTFYYTIYPTGDRPVSPVFSSQNITWMNDIGGGDQRWGFTEANINVLDGLEGGEYTLEFYAEMEGNNPTKKEFDSNNGNNYLVHFELCEDPSDGGTISGDHPICSGELPDPFTNVTTPADPLGTLEYQWQMTTSGAAATFNHWSDVGTDDVAYTHSTVLTETTWFRRLARVTCDPVNWENAISSNVVKVSVVNYEITTTGSEIVITDVCGIGETLDVTEDGSNIRFHVENRYYSLNGGQPLPFPAEIQLAGVTAVEINTGGGNDQVDISGFVSAMPDFVVNGGTGDLVFAGNIINQSAEARELEIISGGELTMSQTGTGGMPLHATVTADGNVTVTGWIANGGDIDINTNGNVLVTFAGMQTQGGHFSVSANDILINNTGLNTGLSGGTGGNATLIASGNVVITDGGMLTGGGHFTSEGEDITFSATGLNTSLSGSTGGNVTLSHSGNVFVTNGGVQTGGGNFSSAGGVDISFSDSGLNTSLTGGSGGNIMITHTGNTVITNGGVRTGGGNFSSTGADIAISEGGLDASAAGGNSTITLDHTGEASLFNGGEIKANSNISISANRLLLSGVINSLNGEVHLDTPNGTVPGLPAIIASEGGLTFTPGSRLDIVINGAFPGDGTSSYTRIVVEGPVNLNSATLLLSGVYTPQDSDQFIIVDNDGTDAVNGTFAGLPQGAVLPDFLGSGKDFLISYTGGDGNDVMIAFSVTVDLTVLLQGPFNNGTGLMNTTLNDHDLLPATQPYNTEPWNYAGDETLPVPLPEEVVDWVLVEVRSDEETPVARKAGLLYNDGSVSVQMTVAAGEYHVVVYHRNHAPVMSAALVYIPNEGNPYDLTDINNVYMAGAISLGSSRNGELYGMVGGDATGDGTLKYSGPGNDRGALLNRIIIEGGDLDNPPLGKYWFEDLRMNSMLKYGGANNDRGLIIANIYIMTDSPMLTAVWSSPVPGNVSKNHQQPSNNGPVNVRLVKTNNDLKVVLSTVEAINYGMIDNIQFTLAWHMDDTHIEELISSHMSDFGIAPQGEPVTEGGITHRIFATAGSVFLPDDWYDEEIIILKLDANLFHGDINRIWLADNAFTGENNAMFYVSLWGTDHTGMILDQEVDVSEPGNEFRVNIFPNPASELITLEFHDLQEPSLMLEIYDYQGRAMAKHQLSGEKLQSASINVSNWPPGIYVAQLKGTSMIYRQRFVVVSGL